MALGRRNARNRSSRRGGNGAQGSGGIAVRGYGVGDGRLVEAVGAVVVADEDVGVDVAEADEVVAVLLAGFDTGLVAGDAGVDDAGGGNVSLDVVCWGFVKGRLWNGGESVWTMDMRVLVKSPLHMGI